MTERFEIISIDAAVEAGLSDVSYNGFSCIVENRPDGTRRAVGQDGGEPEDQLLCRDWSWVLGELNALAEERDAEGKRLRTQIDDLVNEMKARSDKYSAAMTAFHAENEKLKASLRNVVGECDFLLRGGDDEHDKCTECGLSGVGMLRDALNVARPLIRTAGKAQ